MIANINYKGNLRDDDLKNLEIPTCKPPHQKVIQLEKCKLLVFPSGKCRLMGLRKPPTNLPFEILNLSIQSITVVYDIGQDINLLTLASQLPKGQCMYEPELFPALRMTKYKPICVNVFSSGKIIIMGLKELAYQKFLSDVVHELLQVYKPHTHSF